MKRLTALAFTLLLVGPNLAARAADAPSIDAFLGTWTGQDIATPGVDIAPDALDLRVERDAGGFRIAWHDLTKAGEGGKLVKARFLPTDRPGVFEYAVESGSFLERMFASPATGNPLEGETLLWARIDVENPILAVYSMSIDPKGSFDLQHYSWTRTENGLHLTFSHKTQDLDSETRIEGELAAVGG